MIDKLALKNRSYRRFQQKEKIGRNLLEELVNLARLSPSGGNLQPLRFCISNDAQENEKVFGHLSWAGYYKDWPGPEEGERPAAYILILADRNASKPPEIDAGIAAQSIMLGAVENGFGGCIIGSIQKEKLHQNLQLPDDYRILLALALGKPKEEVLVEDMENENVKYWRDEEGRHHVPKRKLKDLIIHPKTGE